MKSIYNGGCSREQGLVEEWYKTRGQDCGDEISNFQNLIRIFDDENVGKRSTVELY